MDSYTYNSYARYYDKNFPSDFQRRCNESAALREDYNKRLMSESLITESKVETHTNTNTVLDVGVNSGVKTTLNLSPKVD